MLTQAGVEQELTRLVDAAEDCARDVADRAYDAAQAEHAWKIAHARALLTATGPVAEREAHALLACDRQHQEHRIAQAKLLAAQEAGRMIRASLDALRSVNSNLRNAIDGF